MTPFDVYKTYLSLKNHFTKEKYDYHKYCGKVRAQLQSFYKRKDRYWFERLSRQKGDKEIVDFFVSNFVSCDDPQSLWIGDMIRDGEDRYVNWIKKQQSLSYFFQQEVESIFNKNNFDDMFEIKNNSHPQLIKEYFQDNISLETVVILNKIFNFLNTFDKKMKDPVWEFVSMRIKKYDCFLNIDIFKYKKILKECVL
jgi:hypothetical protein